MSPPLLTLACAPAAAPAPFSTVNRPEGATMAAAGSGVLRPVSRAGQSRAAGPKPQRSTDLGPAWLGVCGYPESMGQSAPELPAETLVSAIDNARRGVVTHITVKGERVAAIVSESTLAMSQLLTALLTSEMAASALPAVLPAAFPWASSLPDTDTHLKAFAGELREAVIAESPERVGRVLDNWQAVAEVRAGERST